MRAAEWEGDRGESGWMQILVASGLLTTLLDAKAQTSLRCFTRCDLKATGRDCLRQKGGRPFVPSNVPYKAERRGNRLFWTLGQ